MRPPLSHSSWALAAALLAPVLLSGCGSPSFHFDAPLWKAGYAWEYEERSSTDSSVTGVPFAGLGDAVGPSAENGTRRVDVFNSTGRSVEGIPFYTASEIRRVTPTGKSLISANVGDQSRAVVYSRNLNPITPAHVDWATAAVQLGPSAEDEEPTPFGGAMDREFRWLEFPLKKGRAWSQQRSLLFDGLPSSFVIRATKLETVTVPAGEFRCVKLHGEERPDLEFIRGLLEAQLRQDGGRVTKLELDLRATVDYHYCPDVANIVKMKTKILAHVEVRGRTADGTPFDFTLNAHSVADRTLKRFGLLAAPEKPLSFALEVEGGVFLPKPISQIGQLRVELLSTQPHINWADENETVQMGVRIFNVSAQEARLRAAENPFARQANESDFQPTYDHGVAEVVWSIKGMDGNGTFLEQRRVVEDGLTLKPSDFARSGLYQIDAILIEKAHGNFPRTEIDRDFVFFEALYNRTISVRREPTSPEPATVARFPVELAADTVTVVATSPLPVGTSGCALVLFSCLRAEDEQGRPMPDDDPEPARFHAEQVYEGTNGTWAVRFSPTLPGDTIDFHVEVRYAPKLGTRATVRLWA